MRMMKTRTIAATLVLLLVSGAAFGDVTLKHKWVYVSMNLITDRNIDRLEVLMERAKKAGYTGILLADGKFAKLDLVGPRYAVNARRVVRKAKELDLELIPCIFHIGYASGTLAHDPNLVEGVPAVDEPFVVKAGRLVPDASVQAKLVNGDFEDADPRGRFAGWHQENVGQSVFVDRDIVKSGRASVRMQDIRKHSPQHGHCRLNQVIRTKPFQPYILSVWIKTENFEYPGGIRLLVTGNKRPNLVFQQFRIARTQDWKPYHVAFSSLECDEVRVYCGVWKGRGGKVWWDGLTMRPNAFVNVIRRDSAPVVLRSPDGRTTYVEGRDFSRIVDAKLGRMPWPGSYGLSQSPPVVTVPAGSRLREGDRVLASYYHVVLTKRGQVTCNLVEAKIYALLDDEMRRMHALFGAKYYMMSHDEIRVGGWTPDYNGKTMGEALAMNIKRCRDIMKKHAPDATPLVWADMFDPNHNAHGDYYLVKTTWADSWKGLTPDVVMIDWFARKAPETMKFFHDLNRHEQLMAGYYDGDVAANVKQWMTAAKDSPANVTGIIYTTWRGRYDDLEKFIAEVRKYEK